MRFDNDSPWILEATLLLLVIHMATVSVPMNPLPVPILPLSHRDAHNAGVLGVVHLCPLPRPELGLRFLMDDPPPARRDATLKPVKAESESSGGGG